jgi:hypothetical protein
MDHALSVASAADFWHLPAKPVSTGIFKVRAARGAIGLHDGRTLQQPQ